MSVLQMSPEEIYRVFITRISKTNLLFNTLTEDTSLELCNTIYFKYYFDITTAIEATIRGITFVEGDKHRYIEHIAKPSSDSIAYFKDYEEVKALCGIDNLFLGLDKLKFESDFFNKLAALNGRSISMSFVNDGTFSERYTKVRKTRNILAHGLKAESVDYDTNTIESFLFVFFVLHSYYSKIYSTKKYAK